MTAPVAWFWDGADAARNPVPDWWDEHRLDEIGGRLVHTHHPGGRTTRELVDDAARLVELAGIMGVEDEELAAALAVLDAGGDAAEDAP